MLLVTGGAGFIGSNVVAGLNAAGRTDITVNDRLGTDTKWRNLGKRQIADFVAPADLWRWLEGRAVEAVIHLGAIADTTATDADLVMETNFRLSLRLLDWCTIGRAVGITARRARSATASRAHGPNSSTHHTSQFSSAAAPMPSLLIAGPSPPKS